MQTKDRGFSLVEILVTIAIVGVLAMIAIPSYRNYTLTASLSQAFSLLDEERIKIEIYYETHGVMPTSGSEVGIVEFPNFDLVTQLRWGVGIPGQRGIDIRHVGYFKPIMDLRSFGDEYSSYNSTFFFVGRGDQSGRITWECVVDEADTQGLELELLPASCHTI